MTWSSVLVLLACTAMVSGQADLVLDVKCKAIHGMPQFEAQKQMSAICTGERSAEVRNDGDQQQTGTNRFILYWDFECHRQIDPSSGAQLYRFDSGQEMQGIQPGESRSWDFSSSKYDGSLPNCSPGCLMFAMETVGASPDTPIPVLHTIQMEQAESVCGTKGLQASLSVQEQPGLSTEASWILQQTGDGSWEAPLSDIVSSVTLNVNNRKLPERSWPWSMIAFVRRSGWGANIQPRNGSGCNVPHVSLDDIDLGTMTTMSVNAGTPWREDSNLANMKLEMYLGECPICGSAELVVAFDPFSESEDDDLCDNFWVRSVNITCPASISQWSGTALTAITGYVSLGNTLIVKKCTGHNRPQVFRHYQNQRRWEKVDSRNDPYTLIGYKRQQVWAARVVAEGESKDPQFCSKVFKKISEAEWGTNKTAAAPSDPSPECIGAMRSLETIITGGKTLPTTSDVDNVKSSCHGSPLIIAVGEAYKKHLEHGGSPPVHVMYRFPFNISAHECPKDPSMFYGQTNAQGFIKPMVALMHRSPFMWKMAAGGDCEPYPRQACGAMVGALAMMSPIRLTVSRDIKVSLQDHLMRRENAKQVVRNILPHLGMGAMDLSYIDTCPLPDPFLPLPVPGVFYRAKGDKIQMTMRNIYQAPEKQYCYIDIGVATCSHCNSSHY